MRESHELEHGIICEKCLCIATKDNYTRIQFSKPIPEDTTGRTKVIARVNFCNSCYEKFKKVTESFMGREFVEYENKLDKIDKLNQLREQLINNDDQDMNNFKFTR